MSSHVSVISHEKRNVRIPPVLGAQVCTLAYWLELARAPSFEHKMLLVFTALFAWKHGIALVSDSIEKVQPGLFRMFLENVRRSQPSHAHQ